MGLKKAWAMSRPPGPSVEPEGVLCMVWFRSFNLERLFWQRIGGGREWDFMEREKVGVLENEESVSGDWGISFGAFQRSNFWNNCPMTRRVLGFHKPWAKQNCGFLLDFNFQSCYFN